MFKSVSRLVKTVRTEKAGYKEMSREPGQTTAAVFMTSTSTSSMFDGDVMTSHDDVTSRDIGWHFAGSTVDGVARRLRRSGERDLNAGRIRGLTAAVSASRGQLADTLSRTSVSRNDDDAISTSSTRSVNSASISTLMSRSSITVATVNTISVS